MGKNMLSFVEVSKTKMLVSLIPDYYVKNDGKFSAEATKERNYSVGRIEKVGSGFDESIVGKLAFFYKHVAEEVEIKKSGTYYCLDESHLILIIEDVENEYSPN